MYYAMIFWPSERMNVCVRSLRTSGFKTAEDAQKAIERLKLDGYVKKLGQTKPVWSNLWENENAVV